MADNRDSRQRQPRVEEPKEFEEVVINIDRVSRVVKGGRRFRFKALVVVGDKKKRVGIGVSKGTDVQTAVMKATSVAKKNVVEIPIFKTTIPHEVNAKVGGARVLLMPASLDRCAGPARRGQVADPWSRPGALMLKSRPRTTSESPWVFSPASDC